MTEIRRGQAPGAGDVARAILAALPEPALCVDSRRRVVAVNAAARGVLGVTIEGSDLARSLRHPEALAAVDAVLAGGAARAVEMTLPAPVRQDFVLHVAGAEAVDAAGGAVIVLQNVTAARRAELMRSEFVANASHELRSPLAALTGAIETLREAARDDAAARERFLDVMATEAGRMARLIDDLLSLARIEDREHMPPTAAVDAEGVIRHVIGLLAPRAEARGMTLKFACVAGLAPVAAERDELVQVFENLIDNAIKYAASGTTVEITAEAIALLPELGRAGVSVTVRDRGEGIAREHLPRLTERFYRVDKGRSRRLGGTGLGLAIVKHIVSRHRGRLVIASEPGQGSRFTVHLPAAAAPAGGTAGRPGGDDVTKT